jgi:hypothetical protein
MTSRIDLSVEGPAISNDQRVSGRLNEQNEVVRQLGLPKHLPRTDSKGRCDRRARYVRVVSPCEPGQVLAL